MSTLTRRNGFVWAKDSQSTKVVVGASYLVNVLESGGIASASSTGATITMAGGHGFAANDKLMIGTSASTFSGVNYVSSVTSTTITLNGGTYNVAAGDTIVNLGPDSGIASPNWDGNGLTIYSDPAGTTSETNAQVTANPSGGYGYWWNGNSVWEVIRTTALGPIEVIVDAGERVTNPILGAGTDADITITFDRSSTDQTFKWDDSPGVFAFSAPIQADTQDTAARYRFTKSIDFSTWTSGVSAWWGEFDFTGSAAASKSLDGAFFKLRTGSTATDGTNLNAAIALGGYYEHRSNANATRVYGAEHAASHGGTGTVTTVVGSTNLAQTWTRSGSDAGTGTITTAKGTENNAKQTSGGTLTNGYGAECAVVNSGTGTITTAIANRTIIQNTSTGTITDGQNISVIAPTNSGGGTFTTWTGVSIGEGTQAGSNRSFFSNGALHVLSGKYLYLNGGSTTYDGNAALRGLRWNSSNSSVESSADLSSTGFYLSSVTASITAATTQTQGQGALTTEVNAVSVCANPNDTVTLPTAVAGRHCVIVNNGAQTLQIFPASGDNLGAGVNTATTLAAGSNVHYVAYDATNWESV